MFEWDDARVVLAIHRSGSLTAAARRLGVNQSTVSRRLQAIEERLESRLFVRSGEGYALSPAGERLVPRAERMEEEAIGIEREVTGQTSSLTGVVRITAPDALGPLFLMPLLAELHEKHPELDFEISAVNRIVNLTKREADMAIRVGEAEEGRLVVRRLADLGFGVYASRTYLRARGRPKGDDFSGHDLVTYEESMQRVGEARWIKARSRNTRVVLRSQSSHAQLWATVAGLGLALLPCYLADPHAELVRLRVPNMYGPRPVLLALHPDLRPAARIRATSEFLAQAFARRRAVLLGASAKAR